MFENVKATLNKAYNYAAEHVEEIIVGVVVLSYGASIVNTTRVANAEVRSKRAYAKQIEKKYSKK